MKQPSMMSRPVALLIAVLVVILTTHAVEATVATTCKAAAASDPRVNAELCMSHLGTQRGSSDADAWGLAKVASLAGVNSASLAIDDVRTLLKGSPSLQMKPALAKCEAVFGGAATAFAGASDELNARSYAAGRKKLDEALAQAQDCNAAFGLHGVTLPQPLAQHTVDSIQLAIIASAITGLIK